MKNIFLITVFLIALSSCAAHREAVNRHNDQYPALATKKNKTGCNLFPKPVFK
jgi:hypothetical protein